MSKKNSKGMLCVYSLLFAFAAVLTASGYKQFCDRKNFLDYDLRIFTSISVLIFLTAFVSCFLIVSFINQKLIAYENFREDDGYEIIPNIKPAGYFAVFCACWLIYLIQFLTFYPGTAMNDTINCIMQEKSDLIPMFFMLIIKGSFEFFCGILKDATDAFAVLAFVQMTLFSLTVAYICFWMAKKKVPKTLVIFSVCFYAMLPIIGNYSIALLKDTWFSIGFLLLLPTLYDYLESKKLGIKEAVMAFLAIWLMWTTRTNGQVALICLLVSVVFKKKKKAIPVMAILLVVILTELAVKNVYWKDVESTAVREAASVPLSQISYTYANGGNIPEEAAEVFEKVLPGQKWISGVNFSLVDKIKFDEEFDLDYMRTHNSEFVKAWAQTFRDNPKLFAEAYIYHSFGYWNLAFWQVDSINQNQSTFFSVLNNVEKETEWGVFADKIGLENRPVIKGGLHTFLDKMYWTFVNASMLFSGGVLFWAEFLCLLLLAIRKRYNDVIVLSPLFFTWLTFMIASPDSLIYRYIFFMLLSLPFSICLLFIRKKAIGQGDIGV